MVSKEGQPTLGSARNFRRSLYPTRDGSLGKFKTEHAEFPVDPRRFLGGVLNDHTEDQFPNLLRRRSPSDLPPDSDDGFGRYDDEGLLPGRSVPPSDYSEELIEEAEARAWMSTLQRDELLTQSKILENETSPPAKEANQHSETEPYEMKHVQDL